MNHASHPMPCILSTRQRQRFPIKPIVLYPSLPQKPRERIPRHLPRPLCMPPQMIWHIPINPLNPRKHTRRCIHALKAHALQIQYRRENRLNGNEMRKQDLRNSIIRVDECLELVVAPLRRDIIQVYECSVCFDGLCVCVVDDEEEGFPVHVFAGRHGEVVDGVEGESCEVEVGVGDAVGGGDADAVAHVLEVPVFAECLEGVSIQGFGGVGEVGIYVEGGV